MKVKTGDIIVYHDMKAQVIDTSTNNGIGIRYLEGPKTNWEDWVVNTDMFSLVEEKEFN